MVVPKTMTVISLNIERELYAWLKEDAKSEGRETGPQIRWILKQYKEGKEGGR